MVVGLVSVPIGGSYNATAVRPDRGRDYDNLLKRLWISIQLGRSHLDLIREKHRLERELERSGSWLGP